ncbi:DUF1080 domain-containing protein [Catenovulum sp. 2E275]|uniref:3-keto-disaccharide hydrolase n=1 Tax=Catenovulum sp. 2E275 TaxID=2980497 RepID=UPI0021CF8B9F|nr:DUF1080 domain-containing protein [Catenovulum sp. 2E275]MCU4677624.1 DUF1080 domain-containing protein [Catenovulum sp. 2E275]
MIKQSLLVALLLLSGCTHTQVENNSRTSLLQSLDQWQNVYNDGEAKLVDGEIELISKHNWFFLSKKQYKNFIFEAEVKMPSGITEYYNSGFIFRAQVRDKGEFKEAYGYQAEVDPSDRKWSGGLYDQGRREWLNPVHDTRSHPDEDFKLNLSPQWTTYKSNAYKAAEWNHYKIECIGSELKIYLNGVLTTHVIDTKDAQGFVGIQHHGSKAFAENGARDNVVRFRNIFITEL